MIAVVVTVYRQGHFLDDSVLSLARQTMPGIEIVIVDDGCPSPTTPRVARRLAQMLPHVTYLRTPNGGVAHARNYGTRYALAAWPSVQAVFFLDADDRLSPHTLRTLWEPLAAAPASVGWAYCNYDTFFGIRTGRWAIAPPFNEFRELLECQNGAESLVHRRVFEAGIFQEESRELTWEDYEFFLHASTRGFSGIHVPDAGIFYRTRAYSRLSEIVHDKDAIVQKIKARHAAAFEPRARTRLEHEHMPRFLLVTPGSGQADCFTNPFERDRRRLAVEELRAAVAQYVDEYPDTAVYVPPVVLVATPEVAQRLGSSPWAPGALFQLQQAVREHTVVAVTPPEGPDNSAMIRDAYALDPGTPVLLVAGTFADFVDVAAHPRRVVKRDASRPGGLPLPVPSRAFAANGVEPLREPVARLLDVATALPPGRAFGPRDGWVDPMPHQQFALQVAHSHDTTFPWFPAGGRAGGTDLVFLVDVLEERDPVSEAVAGLALAVTNGPWGVRAHLVLAEAPDMAMGDVTAFTTVSSVASLPFIDRNEALLIRVQSADWVVDTGTVAGRTILWHLKQQRRARYAALLLAADSVTETVRAAAVAAGEDPPDQVRGGVTYLLSRYYEPLVDRLLVSDEATRRWCINRGAPPEKVYVLGDTVGRSTPGRDWASRLLGALGVGGG